MNILKKTHTYKYIHKTRYACGTPLLASKKHQIIIYSM